MTDHRKLLVWQKAVALTEEVYRATTTLPSTERFGLVTQMRRASVSIPSNIAESCGRSSRRDRARFLEVAGGSILELETQLEVSRRLAYISNDVFQKLIRQTSEVGRMLNGLKRSILLDS
jgi:four helix bundle protein